MRLETHRRWVVLLCFSTILSTLVAPSRLSAQALPLASQTSQAPSSSDEHSTSLVPVSTNTNNATSSWEAVTLPNNITTAIVSGLAVDPNNSIKIFLATRSGLYQSNDAGGNWNRLEASQFTNISEITIAPGDGQRLYVRTPDLFRSSDGGATWAKVALPAAVCGLTVAPSDANRLYARSCGGSNQPSIFRSDNGGDSWQTTITSFAQTFDQLAVIPNQPDQLIAANFGHIYRSGDGGATWTELLHGKYFKARPIFDNSAANILYMGHWRGVLRSTDGGLNWQESGFEQELSTVMIAPDGVGIVGGFFTSTWQIAINGNDWSATKWDVPQPLQEIWRSRLDGTRSYALNPAGLWRLTIVPQPQPPVTMPVATNFAYLPLIARTTGLPNAAGSVNNDMAIERMNYYRDLVGITPLQQHPALMASAENHVAYYLANRSDAGAWIHGGHGQVTGKPHFMGQWPRDRMKLAGFPNGGGSEVLHFIADPVNSIDDWMSTIFHRVVMLDPLARYAGYSNGKVDGHAIDVMDFASGPVMTGVWLPALPFPLGYPFDGQTNIPVSWTGNESPDPLPPGATRPLGYPFTLQGVRGKLQVTSATLRTAAGETIAIHPNSLDCAEKFNCYTVIAVAPLQPNTAYIVDVAGDVAGQQFQRQWRFTTGSESAVVAATEQQPQLVAPLQDLQ